MHIKGVLLRQEVLLEKERLENVKLKIKTGNKKEIKKAQRRFDAARKKFCNFLKDAEWVD